MISSGIFQFSQAQVDVFLLKAFVYFSFLVHFPITSLVVFAELSILLSYEVFVLKFYLQSFMFVWVLSAILFVPAQFCRSCQSYLISLFCTQFNRFTLNFTFLHWWNCTVHWFGINRHLLSQWECRNCCLYIIRAKIASSGITTNLRKIINRKADRL